MNIKKILPLLVLFSLFALPAAAQTFGPVADLFGNIQELIGSGLDGISANPAIWMKIIFILLLFIVLYNLAFKAFMKDANKGSKIFFSMIVAVAMVAPIPNALAEGIFNSLGLVGGVIVLLPVLGIMIMTHKMTSGISLGNKWGNSNDHLPGRGMYFLAFGIWMLTLTFYINGIALQVDSPLVKSVSAYLSLLALGYLCYYGYKMILPTSTSGDELQKTLTPDDSVNKFIPGTQAHKNASNERQNAEIIALKKVIPTAIARLPHIQHAILELTAQAYNRTKKDKKANLHNDAVIQERNFVGVQATVKDFIKYLVEIRQFQTGLNYLDPRALAGFNKDITLAQNILKVEYKALIDPQDEANWANMLHLLFAERNGRITVALTLFQAALAKITP